MKQNRRVAIWLLSSLIVGGMVVFFALPLALTQTILPTQSAVPPPPALTPPPGQSAHDPQVLELLETTYLGHKEEFPDPEEPAVVLRKYLERDTHKYFDYHEQGVLEAPELNRELEEWEALINQYPQSRHALAGLAYLYRIKAELTQDASWSRKAAEYYIRAARAGLSHGKIRYTRELSELLVALSDKTTLDQIFQFMLASPRDKDRDHYYLALVDYADGLARLSDDKRAWGYFEEAIAFHPENNIEAFNSYARHLLNRGQAKEALELLDRMTPDMRIRFMEPVFLRKEAMELLGVDTASADREIAKIQQRMSQGAAGFTLLSVS